ncbi:NtaA/DmoA family FMN-dependent monooxygenase [Demequina sp.]|uniref:NtaA/DmoA family FMN-dependent monooxygenase n=1 Tax=Demequina sp. TaxID=2050685 RepID=UPI003A884A5C
MRPHLCIGLSLSPTWLRGSAWRRPDSRAEELFDAQFYVDAALAAEAAHLDFVFKPDVLSLDPTALATGMGFATLDPFVMMTAVAQVTERIGLIPTTSATFVPPYLAARQVASLDRISRGRAGLNVVMSMAGNENFGVETMPPSHERFAAAHEWIEDLHALGRSFPADALVTDRSTGQFADAALVSALPDRGAGRPRGPLNVPAWGGGRTPIVQAGGSPAGRDFAAARADAVFAAAPTLASALEQRTDLRRRAVDHGREADDVRVLPGLAMFLAPTREEALALFREGIDESEVAKSLAGLSRLLGTDLGAFDVNAPIPVDAVSVEAHDPDPVLAGLGTLIARGASPRELALSPEGAASLHWTVIGTPADAVEAVVARAQAGAIDGFIALPSGSWESLRLFTEQVVPALAARGLVRSSYESDTLRGHWGMPD